ncbi:MAG: Ig-like domain-containing protein [Candidatus Nitrotoga sp.]
MHKPIAYWIKASLTMLVMLGVSLGSQATPTVSLTSPAAGTQFGAPATITLTADAIADTGQTVKNVKFYRGTTLIGTDTTAPYAVTWNNAGAGTYSLTAKATSNLNLVNTSAASSITVTTKPTVSITSPSNNAGFVSGSNITINANAAASSGQSITQVEFFANTVPATTPIHIGTDTSSPYSVTWTAAPAGSYNLTAKATDNLGGSKTSGAKTINVTASTNIAPTVSITSPANNANYTAPATITITADATDSDGTVTKVDFYESTNLIGADTTAPYSLDWTNVAAGTYSVTSVATDDVGATTTSAVIQVTVGSGGVAQIYYIHTDHLNTPRVIEDQNQNTVWRWDNDDPFAHNAPNADPNNTGTTFVYNHRLPGQYYDQETGNNYNLFRDYDPRIGRYIQSDPIGLLAGINTYAYVKGNPLSHIDPWGLDTFVANRDLSAFGNSARPSSDVVTHTFTFSTNPDGSIAHAYSWGNDANLRGWNLDQPIDMSTAALTIQQGVAQRVAPSFMDPYYRKAYDQLNRPENEHSNGVVVNNCKVETKKLNDLAWKLWSGK